VSTLAAGRESGIPTVCMWKGSGREEFFNLLQRFGADVRRARFAVTVVRDGARC